MNQKVNDHPPARWEKTVTIIKCGYVDENVSIMVKQDWSSHCAWYKQYKEPMHGEKIKADKTSKTNVNECQGPFCKFIGDLLNRLQEEEPTTFIGKSGR